jgi:hypothetical protein
MSFSKSIVYMYESNRKSQSLSLASIDIISSEVLPGLSESPEPIIGSSFSYSYPTIIGVLIICMVTVSFIICILNFKDIF